MSRVQKCFLIGILILPLCASNKTFAAKNNTPLSVEAAKLERRFTQELQRHTMKAAFYEHKRMSLRARIPGIGPLIERFSSWDFERELSSLNERIEHHHSLETYYRDLSWKIRDADPETAQHLRFEEKSVFYNAKTKEAKHRIKNYAWEAALPMGALLYYPLAGIDTGIDVGHEIGGAVGIVGGIALGAYVSSAGICATVFAAIPSTLLSLGNGALAGVNTAHAALCAAESKLYKNKANRVRDLAASTVKAEMNPLARPLLTKRAREARTRKNDQKQINLWVRNLANSDSLQLAQNLNQPGRKSGNTLLHRAIARGDIDLTELLIHHGADPIQRNLKGTSPLGLALQINRWKLFPNSLKEAIGTAPLALLHPQEQASVVKSWIRNEMLTQSEEIESWIQDIPPGDLRQEIFKFAVRESSDSLFLKLLEWDWPEEENSYDSLHDYFSKYKLKDSNSGETNKIRASLEAGIKGTLSRTELGQLSRLVETIVLELEDIDQLRLLIQFVQTSPFLKEENFYFIHEKAEELVLEQLQHQISPSKPSRSLAKAEKLFKRLCHSIAPAKATCPVCLEGFTDPRNVGEAPGLVEISCSCQFHPDCLRYWADSQLKRAQMETPRCPGCGEEASAEILEYLNCSADEIKLFRIRQLQHSLSKHLQEWKFCPSPDCWNGRVLGKTGSAELDCVLCGKKTCLRCNQTAHGIYQCYDKDGQRLFDQMIAKREHEFKKCPTCATVIEKHGGCDHMTCKQCKYEFSWSSGKPF